MLLSIIVIALIKCPNIPKENNSSTWKNVEISEQKHFANCMAKKFDLSEIVTGADYVFSGTVINQSEYEVEWKDENNEKWGPFSNSVIEVEINKEYYGESPVGDKTIKVYYPYSMSTLFDKSFCIENNNEYIFITRLLDEEFVKEREKNNPYDKYDQEKYADVYISNTDSNILVVEDDTVFLNKEFFLDEIGNECKIKKTSKSVTISEGESDWYIAIDKPKFDKKFLKLFKQQKNKSDNS